MAETETKDPAPQDAPGSKEPAAPAAPAGEPTDSASAKQMVSLRSDLIGKLKREAAEKGAKHARLETAKQLGYDSIEEMEKDAEAAKKRREEEKKRGAQQARQPNGNAPPNGKNGNGSNGNKPRELREAERRATEVAAENERLQKERTRLAAAARRGEVRAREAQEAAERAEARAELKIAAIRKGCTDPDYALTLLERAVADMDEDGIKKFDEDKFFDGLKETHPAIYMQRQVPVTTGTGGGDKRPPAPDAKDAAARAVPAKDDYKEMPRANFWQKLGERYKGVRRPTS